MKINSSYILLKEIRCYAYHGVAPQENLIGNEYLIDLNATRAYKVAYPRVKNDEVAAAAATRLLRNGCSLKIAGTR